MLNEANKSDGILADKFIRQIKNTNNNIYNGLLWSSDLSSLNIYFWGFVQYCISCNKKYNTNWFSRNSTVTFATRCNRWM